MKTKLYLLFFFVFPLFMSACRGDDPIPDPPVDGKRTVLVYMAADNSINPLASFTEVRVDYGKLSKPDWKFSAWPVQRK